MNDTLPGQEYVDFYGLTDEEKAELAAKSGIFDTFSDRPYRPPWLDFKTFISGYTKAIPLTY